VAEATIDGRMLPGFDPDQFLDELRPVLGAHFDYEIELTSPPLEARHDTALYSLMADALRRNDPSAAAVVPYMMSGATDAKYLAPHGIPTYGFAPLKLPPDMKLMEMFHAHDERVPVDGLAWGVRVLYEVVEAYCGRE
jgi:acetylornithine deacetylase/succinyl-diaminopimelate desuccinylase-like protein